MKLHAALPQNMTKENLAKWITENAIETREHEEKFDLTPEEIAKFEHDSAVASIEIAKLDEVTELFKLYTKKGTPVVEAKVDGQPQMVPDAVSVKIPPSKGYDVLKANRDYASEQINLGYRIEKTGLYGIPYPESKQVVFVDIEGNLWDQYKYAMNPIQVQKYDMPLMSAGKEPKPLHKKKESTEDLPFE